MPIEKNLKSALGNWTEKLAVYEYELSVTMNPSLKYELKKQIQECEHQISILNSKLQAKESNLATLEYINPSSRVLTRKVLILSANPSDTSQLRLSEEIRDIKESLKLLKGECQILIESVGAARYRDLSKHILEYQPNIVHFSGHGSGESGLLFEDPSGYTRAVDAEALAGLFELFSNQIECVVLNACYSQVQAEAIAQHIQHVIGMDRSIADSSAIEFSIGFYSALRAGRPYEFAYKLGRQSIGMAGSSSEISTPHISGTSHRGKQSIRSGNSERGNPVQSESSRYFLRFEETYTTNVVTLFQDPQSKEIKKSVIDIEVMHEKLDDNLSLQILPIPGGTFEMGSLESEKGHRATESPQHSVEVSPFFMSRFPITQFEWEYVSNLPQVEISLSKAHAKFKGKNLPMEGVSWYEAVEFCMRLSKRTGRQYKLPSEAQWEYACRAGSTDRFCFGDTIPYEFANYKLEELTASSRYQTSPIDFFGVSNAFGLSDMHGNIFEWCSDLWHQSYKDAPIDSSAWHQDGQEHRRVIRGGAYNHRLNDCRSATRYYLDPNRRSGFIVGLRIIAE